MVKKIDQQVKKSQLPDAQLFFKLNNCCGEDQKVTESTTPQVII